MSLFNDMGITHVSYTTDQYNAFIKMPNGSLSLYNGLLSSDIGGRGGYWLEGDRIYYNKGVDDCCGNTVILNVLQLYAPMKTVPNDELNDNLES